MALLRRPRRSSAITGVGIYTADLMKTLDNGSVEYKEIEMQMDLNGGIVGALTNGLIRPFFQILAARKDVRIFHSTDDFCCFFFPLMRNNKKVLTFHHVVSGNDGDSKPLFAWRLISWIGIRWADAIIAISDQTCNEIVNKYGIDRNRILVVRNRLSDEYVTLGVEKKKYIGCVSTLIQRKNVDSLLRVFKEFADTYGMEEYTLKICGKGPEEAALRKLTHALGLEDRVEFLSNLTSEEVILFYNEASMIANPSLHEGFGRTTLEAQLCSAPVVYFRKAEIPEEVIRFAVPAEDESDFARKMYELLTDEELYNKVTEEGLEYARTFQGDMVEVLDLYKRLSA